MKMLWKSDLGQGKHDPLEIVAVETKSGSRISADLVVAMDPHSGPALSQYRDDGQYVPVGWYQGKKDEADGLLEVIEAQLAAIDELGKQLEAPEVDPGHTALKEWAEQIPDAVADLCVALGYAAHPMTATGIRELDVLLGLVR